MNAEDTFITAYYSGNIKMPLAKCVAYCKRTKRRIDLNGRLEIIDGAMEFQLIGPPEDIYTINDLGKPGERITDDKLWALSCRNIDGLTILSKGLNINPDFRDFGAIISIVPKCVLVKFPNNSSSKFFNNSEQYRFYRGKRSNIALNKNIHTEISDEDKSFVNRSTSELSIFTRESDGIKIEYINDSKFSLFSINTDAVNVDIEAYLPQALLIATGTFPQFDIVAKSGQAGTRLEIREKEGREIKLPLLPIIDKYYDQNNDLLFKSLSYMIKENKKWSKISILYFNLAIASGDFNAVFPLSLCVAIESLLKNFDCQRIDDPDFKLDCDKISMFIDENIKTERNKRRMKGALSSLANNKSPQSIIPILSERFGLPKDVIILWKKYRHPLAHGGEKTADPDFPELMKLWHFYNIMVSKIIGYSGHVIDYSNDWMPKPQSTLSASDK